MGVPCQDPGLLLSTVRDQRLSAGSRRNEGLESRAGGILPRSGSNLRDGTDPSQPRTACRSAASDLILQGRLTPPPSVVEFRSPNDTRPMSTTFVLESPAGDLAVFRKVADFMTFEIGNDIVELSIPDARKVWKALLLCQWQRETFLSQETLDNLDALGV